MGIVDDEQLAAVRVAQPRCEVWEVVHMCSLPVKEALHASIMSARNRNIRCSVSCI